MIEAVGLYSNALGGLKVAISATKTVDIKFAESNERFVEGSKYRITAEIQAEYVKDKEVVFKAKVLSATLASVTVHDFARYRGVFRLNEYAGAVKESQGVELNFYRGDAFSSELRCVELSMASGWVTVVVPKDISSYAYRGGDLIYVDGKLYHKLRDVGGVETYELCVRAEVCHKVDGTEYWEKVRAAKYRASKRSL